MSTYEQTVFDQVEKYLISKRDFVVSRSGHNDGEYKPDNSVVTEIDKMIETDVRQIINRIDSSVDIIGEEFKDQLTGSDTFWTLDPIDGTEHYIRGNPHYIFMIGLVKEGKPTASLMYNFGKQEMFVGHVSTGATKNGKDIRVSKRSSDRAIVEIETELRGGYDILERIDNAFFARQTVAYHAGYGFTQVASGLIEARAQVNGPGYIYDFLPGCILIKSAGGVVRNINDEGWDYKDLDTIASNAVIADDLIKAIKG
ncbi:MAG: inositol monophosphatase family protein [Patescibacteria group bacterium]